MIKILVDTNVIINYLTEREDKYTDESKQVMMMCAKKELEGYVAFHSLSIIWYFSGRQKLPEEVRREWVNRVCKILTISSANNEAVLEAANNVEFKDFEDNLQECCAVAAGADYIITANLKDYEHSRVKAVTPDQFVRIISANF